MKVAITGGGGFVGRHLTAKLLDEGREVLCVDTQGDFFDPRATALLGSFADEQFRREIVASDCDAIVHLATIPGGAAEADPKLARAVNVDGTYDLLDALAAGAKRVRVVFASSIAVFGNPLPAQGVDDHTPLSPELHYGGHKAMMETAIAMYSNRGSIDGISLRLPGILARPRTQSGMKSAFISDIFHALKAGESFTCRTRPEARTWVQSVKQVCDNLAHALVADASHFPRSRAITLPATHLAMGELVSEIADQCGTDRELISWEPDSDLEAAFAAFPPLSADNAINAGFADDGSAAILVKSALETL